MVEKNPPKYDPPKKGLYHLLLYLDLMSTTSARLLSKCAKNEKKCVVCSAATIYKNKYLLQFLFFQNYYNEILIILFLLNHISNYQRLLLYVFYSNCTLFCFLGNSILWVIVQCSDAWHQNCYQQMEDHVAAVQRRTFEQVVTMTIISATRACRRSQLWIQHIAYYALCC